MSFETNFSSVISYFTYWIYYIFW